MIALMRTNVDVGVGVLYAAARACSYICSFLHLDSD